MEKIDMKKQDKEIAEYELLRDILEERRRRGRTRRNQSSRYNEDFWWPFLLGAGIVSILMNLRFLL
jgi:hypothetical protein